MNKFIKWVRRYFRKHRDQRFIIHVVGSDGFRRRLKWSEFVLPKVGTGLTATNAAEYTASGVITCDADTEHDITDTPILNYFDAELLAFRLNRMRSKSFVHAFSYETHRVH